MSTWWASLQQIWSHSDKSYIGAEITFSSCQYTHGVTCWLLGPHDTPPCVLIAKSYQEWCVDSYGGKALFIYLFLFVCAFLSWHTQVIFFIVIMQGSSYWCVQGPQKINIRMISYTYHTCNYINYKRISSVILDQVNSWVNDSLHQFLENNQIKVYKWHWKV